jgi:2'-5' RNA ligase
MTALTGQIEAMQRLFLAIVPPADIVERLTDLQWGVSRSRWTSPNQLHVTLRFIGEVRHDEAATIQRAMAGVVGAPFSMRMGGVGHFPPRGRVKSLWAGLRSEDDLAPLIAMRHRVDTTLLSIGLARDGRRFAPHITLARLDNTPESQVVDWLAGRSLFTTPSFEVDELVLMRSILRQEGSEYQVVARIPLLENP